MIPSDEDSSFISECFTLGFLHGIVDSSYVSGVVDLDQQYFNSKNEYVEKPHLLWRLLVQIGFSWLSRPLGGCMLLYC